MSATAFARWDMDIASEPPGYEGAILEARQRGDPFAAQLSQDLDDLRASLRKSWPRYRLSAPSASVATALLAMTAASSAVLAAAVTGSPYLSAGLLVAGIVALPRRARSRTTPRPRRQRQPKLDWPAQLERECLDQVVKGYRAGTIPARAALPSYTARIDWDLGHAAKVSEYRPLLLEAIAVARDAGDALGLMRLQARLEFSEVATSRRDRRLRRRSSEARARADSPLRSSSRP